VLFIICYALVAITISPFLLSFGDSSKLREFLAFLITWPFDPTKSLALIFVNGFFYSAVYYSLKHFVRRLVAK
jgi:hypothetical protein